MLGKEACSCLGRLLVWCAALLPAAVLLLACLTWSGPRQQVHHNQQRHMRIMGKQYHGIDARAYVRGTLGSPVAWSHRHLAAPA